MVQIYDLVYYRGYTKALRAQLLKSVRGSAVGCEISGQAGFTDSLTDATWSAEALLVRTRRKVDEGSPGRQRSVSHAGVSEGQNNERLILSSQQ